MGMSLAQSFGQGRGHEVTVGDGGEVDVGGRWLVCSSGQGGECADMPRMQQRSIEPEI